MYNGWIEALNVFYFSYAPALCAHYYIDSGTITLYVLVAESLGALPLHGSIDFYTPPTDCVN